MVIFSNNVWKLIYGFWKEKKRIKEANKNFTRIENIEKFLRTESILIFDKYEYYSEDLYQTQNALGIHDGYWTSFCEINGRTISIKKGEGNSSSNYLYLLNDTTMVMLVDDNVAIYSISSLEKELEIHNYDSSISYVASCYDASIDKGVYIYSFVIESSSLNSCNLIDFKANIK